MELSYDILPWFEKPPTECQKLLGETHRRIRLRVQQNVQEERLKLEALVYCRQIAQSFNKGVYNG